MIRSIFTFDILDRAVKKPIIKAIIIETTANDTVINDAFNRDGNDSIIREIFKKYPPTYIAFYIFYQ